MYCDTNQFLALPFHGSHPKPHGARGLGKNYHIRFNPNLGHGIFAICCIPCAYVARESMIDQPWISGAQLKKRHATSLSSILIIGQFCDHITIGISFT